MFSHARILALPQILALLALPTACTAEEPVRAVEVLPIVEQFHVAKKGDPITVPVRIGEKRCSFILDTGSERTICHDKLPLGDPIGWDFGSAPSGEFKYYLYNVSNTRIGTGHLRIPNPLAGMNLKNLQKFGISVDGILGMDVIGKYVIQIDFDRGEPTLFDSVPPNSGEAIPLIWLPGWSPEVEVQIPGLGKKRFTIDTGHIGPNSGSIDADAIKKMSKSGDLASAGTVDSMDLANRHEWQLFRGRRLEIAGFSVTNPVFEGTSDDSVLGLWFLSRFVATFDFPGHKIYLRKGKEYNRRDLWARFGIAMRNVDGVIVFSSVDKNSLSEKAGFQAGDVLVKVGEFAATKGSLAPIWSALGGAGKLKVIIRRGSIEKSLLLDTDENAGGSYDH
jgi:hypothetical protein